MPQPSCDVCGRRVKPEDRVTDPFVLDDAGRVTHRSRSWHRTCLEDELDGAGEALEDPYPDHEDPFWTPH